MDRDYAQANFAANANSIAGGEQITSLMKLLPLLERLVRRAA